MEPPWQPISTAPTSGKFMIATYFPSSWGWQIETVSFGDDSEARNQAYRLKYAKAWRPMLEEPPADWPVLHELKDIP